MKHALSSASGRSVEVLIQIAGKGLPMDVKEYHIDTFVMGDDWKGKFDFLKDKCEVIYLPRTPEISTTKIKTDLNGKDT